MVGRGNSLNHSSRKGLAIMERTVLSINDKNRTIYFKNRELRTPVKIDITGQRLNDIHIAIRLAGITDYTITTTPVEKEPVVDIPLKVEKDVIVEELDTDSEPKSFLERLVKE